MTTKQQFWSWFTLVRALQVLYLTHSLLQSHFSSIYQTSSFEVNICKENKARLDWLIFSKKPLNFLNFCWEFLFFCWLFTHKKKELCWVCNINAANSSSESQCLFSIIYYSVSFITYDEWRAQSSGEWTILCIFMSPGINFKKSIKLIKKSS